VAFRTPRRRLKPISDDAETAAGAGTDVRQCSDALGPRKNLHALEPLAHPLTGQTYVQLACSPPPKPSTELGKLAGLAFSTRHGGCVCNTEK
jgi:hypothetical protein